MLSPAKSHSDAKADIMEAAKRLFATEGFESVSLRQLTQEAGVNLAAVHYHFGSKEALIDAVVENFINPLNRERLRLLDEAEAAAGDDAPPLATVMDAFLRPAFEQVQENERSQQLFFKLLSRCMSRRQFRIPESSRQLLQEIAERFPTALRRTLVNVTEEELLWRLHFTVGVLIHTLAHGETLAQIARGRSGNPTPAAILSMAKAYCCAAFQAPPAPRTLG